MRRSIAKLDGSFYAVNLFRRDDGRRVLASDEANYIREREDFQAIGQIYVNEDIAGEKRHLQGHASIFPLTYSPVTGKEIFELAVGQTLCGSLFLVDPDMQDKPFKKAGIKWQIAFGQGEELSSEGRPYRSGYSFAPSLTG